jgi:EmrB/QacA subfamily drug resistance transporter
MANQLQDYRKYVLYALMMTMMLAAMDTTIVSTAIPQIVIDLGGFEKFSWVFSIYLLAQTVTIPIYGKLADIYGRKMILLVGIIIFLIGSVSSAFAWNIESLILFRGIQGLGAGSIMATVNTIAGDIYSVEERAKVQGWLSSIWGISAIIGPALGGALAEYIDWRWIFIINLPFGILSIVLLVIYFKEKVTKLRPTIDYKGSILILTVVTLFIVFLLESGISWPWISWQTAMILVSIMMLCYWTIRIEKEAKDPMLPLWILKSPDFAYANLSMLFMGIVMMGPEAFLPTFTQASLGLGIIASGFVLASMSIGWPVASSMSGKLYMRTGFRSTAMMGALIILVAVIGFLFLVWPQPIVLVVMDQILIGAGFGLLSTPILVGIQSFVNWEQRGVVTGMNIFFRNLGQSVGTAVFGAAFNNSFQAKMANAPLAMVEKTADVLLVIRNPTTTPEKKLFLEKTFASSMDTIYIMMASFTILIIWSIYKMPKKQA